ncbi:MAG: toprim domain-containing protein [Zetaproteobacteria bacterium]|nr:toprim domain-containing protein [Zetaproteobacteria bacterium]
MDYASVVAFIKDLRGANATVERHGQWVMTNCPLAPWTHARGSDAKPSFGITEKEGEESLFNCMTCHNKGPLDHLLDLMEDYTGDDLSHLREGLGEAEFLSNSLPTWESKRAGSKAKEIVEPLEDEYQYVYESAAGHKYLRKRGISDEGARIMELLVDTDDGHGAERIMFPVKGTDGQLYGYSGRAIKKRVNPKVRDYYGLKKRKFLLGAHLIKPEHEYIIVVEGLFDYANLVQYGYPAVAVMHSGATDEQLKVLLSFMKPIVLMMDDDQAGIEGAYDIADAAGVTRPVYTVEYPPFTKKWYKDREQGADPGNLKPNAIERMLDGKRLM